MTVRRCAAPGARGARAIVLWLVLALTWAVFVDEASAQQPGWGAILERFEGSLASEVADDQVAGIAAGVAVDGDLVWARGFGMADRAESAPMLPSHISRTGSISKTVTAVLMMVLVDQGVIDLDDPVTDYLPEFADVAARRPGTPAVTFRHLASHTAGLIREPRLDGAARGPIDGWREKTVESLRNTAYDSVPGGRYQYSNIGFGALGLALERATGRDFMAMVKEEIFEPLGMTGSSFRIAADGLDERLAAGYVNRRDGSIDAEQPAREHAGRGYKVPNGGVYSTVADLARFAGALSGVPGLQLLTEESRRAMLSVATPEDPDRGYGLGLSLRRNDDGSWTAGHGGSVAGYTATLQFDPEARIAVVLLRNYQSGATNLGGAAMGLLEELRAAGR